MRERTLLYNPSFQHLLLKSIGNKEEVEVAKEIQKTLKQSPPTHLPGNSVNSGGPSRPFPRARQAQVCFSCGRSGHYNRSCWAKRGPLSTVAQCQPLMSLFSLLMVVFSPEQF